jgi:murein DD-endopeptidase MepM/ murein hydrolase activator NlpD
LATAEIAMHYGSSVSTETTGRFTLVLKNKIVEFVHSIRLIALTLGDRVRTSTLGERIRTGLAGRSRQVVVLATLAGVTAIGLLAATTDNTPDPSLTITAAGTAEQQRAAAADQANRSTRDNPAPAEAAPAAPEAAPAAPAPPAPKPDWVIPMPGTELSSCYGPRWGTMHQGIDFAGKENAPIFAMGNGTVFAAGWNYTGYGISVVIDHHNGYLSHYAHMNKTNVSAGQEVHPGDLIGWEGSTGDSTGPHLHFEVHHGMWNQIDPAPWLRDHGAQIGC